MVEIVVAGSAFVMAIVSVGGVIVTWRKNGKSQAARDQEIKDNQKAIIKKLDDDQTGLTALNTRFHNFEVNCAGTRVEFNQRIITTEREINELKTRRKDAP